MIKISELKYSNTNTYLIRGERGVLLFDTGWAGTFPAFCKCMGDTGIPVQEIDYILISHFHPDHMGIAQQIADLGSTIVVMDVQSEYIHSSDLIFAKENNVDFRTIDDEKAETIRIEDSRAFLAKLGIDGEVIHTPGHSDDSISLCLDSGDIFVGDLNPLYELELYSGTQIGESWNRLLERKPKTIYYGHAKKNVIEDGTAYNLATGSESNNPRKIVSRLDNPQREYRDLYDLVSRIMKYTDKGMSIDTIQSKTGADRTFIEDVTRMYMTHQNVGVAGILDRIEIKGR